MKRKVTITLSLDAETLRSCIEQATAELEEESQILFPGSAAREEFIEDCTDCLLDQLDRCGACHLPDYSEQVLDMARLYNYLSE